MSPADNDIRRPVKGGCTAGGGGGGQGISGHRGGAYGNRFFFECLFSYESLVFYYSACTAVCPMYSVLYVDDEQVLLDLCRSYLEKSGDFRVEMSRSAPDAMEKLRNGSFDAIVSDYQMPEMDGIAFLKEVRSRFGYIPFILFTGKGREDIVIEAINNGADFYLQKGGDSHAQFAELAHKIRRAVGQRRAAEELRDNEAQLRLFKASVDWASDQVYWLDFEGNILYVNDSACRTTGYSRDEFLGMTVFDLDPDFTPEVQEKAHGILKQKKTNIFTTRHRHKDGTIGHVEIMANHVSKDGKDYSFAFARDITGRKQTEEALRESEERYRRAHRAVL